MQGILRISEAVAIGIHAVVALAVSEGGRLSGHELAEGMQASEAHLLKVMRLLGKAGIVDSLRGPTGGFRLAHEPGAIHLIAVYEAIEGQFPEGTCLFASPICGGKACPMSGFIQSMNREAVNYFSKTTIGDLLKKEGKVCE
jgi:Rrf2 family protein